MDGITPLDMIESLNLAKNRDRVFKAGEGSGASGSFFFFSYDNKLLIKTLQGKEKMELLNMLDNMIEHFEDTRNKSLLARIYGVFTIKTSVFDDLDIVIM